MATTGYTLTNFSPASNVVYSDHWGGAPSPAKLVLAEIDLTAPANRNATLVHELGEKITVVRLPLDGLAAGLEQLASEGRAVNAWLYCFAQGAEASRFSKGAAIDWTGSLAKAAGALWMAVSVAIGAVYAAYGPAAI